ncbi:hypothetical protein BBK36DRAFT_1138734 [Trichoderma citrinoviride]|uniref:Uncharacterized protein n=1 Tax=Trichoderma citrinoviride TaxID=58853 RepID=A0A2T4BH38_9HYPO|nr:hypothetical protein BBK36DRAFT_1138734 [Trichoderma citrinoviride]PTB68632.1 hypothetical protein BBK36DRAFT_1138734 [Trichoderma citrinoviride]
MLLSKQNSGDRSRMLLEWPNTLHTGVPPACGLNPDGWGTSSGKGDQKFQKLEKQAKKQDEKAETDMQGGPEMGGMYPSKTGGVFCNPHAKYSPSHRKVPSIHVTLINDPPTVEAPFLRPPAITLGVFLGRDGASDAAVGNTELCPGACFTGALTDATPNIREEYTYSLDIYSILSVILLKGPRKLKICWVQRCISWPGSAGLDLDMG